MATTEIDVIGAAIDTTEKEIFGEAFGKEELVEDESGDRTVEQMGEGLEGQHEADDEGDESESDEGDGEELEAAEQGKDKTAKEPEKEGGEQEVAKAEPVKAEPEGRVPPGRLRQATERTRAAEAERDALKASLEAERATARKEIEELKAKFDGFTAAIRQQPPPPVQEQPKPKTAPDIFEDPKGFVDYMNEGFRAELSLRDQKLEEQRIENSCQLARVLHKEVFDKAWETLNKLDNRDPDNQSLKRRIASSPNPGEALVQWHKRNETLREVGDDPVKYREKLTTETKESLMKDPEFRKQLLEELRAEASGADNGKPRNITRLPKSLNGVAGGNAARDADPFQYDDSDSAVFNSAWR